MTTCHRNSLVVWSVGLLVVVVVVVVVAVFFYSMLRFGGNLLNKNRR